MPSEILRLEGVRKSYRTGGVEAEVLHGIDLTLREGEFVALVGPSGSGKSTLLNLVGLLDRPTSGKLSIEGREIGALPDAELTRLRGHAIGFIFQYHNLISAFSAAENVMMPLLLAKGRPDAAMREEAIRLLDTVGLSKWRDHPVMQLSGGQQQRVAVARALAMKPPLVLADEPTGNLDTKTADGVFQVMLDVNRRHGTAFLVVTHNPGLAALCQRVVELVDGQVVRDSRVDSKASTQRATEEARVEDKEISGSCLR